LTGGGTSPSDIPTPDSALKIVVFPSSDPTTFGSFSYLNSSKNSYSPLTLGGSFTTANVDYQDLQFLAANNQIEGTRVYTYRVYDVEGLYAESTITVTPKDGELCLDRVKPEETLVEARSGSDVQIDRQI